LFPKQKQQAEADIIMTSEISATKYTGPSLVVSNDEIPPPSRVIRSARMAQSLSLRALSARAGMPYSTLSKLENGKVALTYDKLIRLAQALNLDLKDIVAGHGEQPLPAGMGRRSVTRAGDGFAVQSDRHAHHYPATDLLGKMMTPIIIEVRARSVEELGGLVRHTGEEYLYILSGAMELHSDLYAPLPLAAGDSVYFDSGMGHAYVRTSTDMCTVLSVCASLGIKRLVGAAKRNPLVMEERQPE
jgi:transcriptional regulator with XRE-family HTH domain